MGNNKRRQTNMCNIFASLCEILKSICFYC